MRLPHSFVALLFAVLASGAVTNNTFDDSNSSFKFVGNWAALSTSSPCSTLNCPAQPDTSQIHEGTWHVGTIHNGDHPYTTIVGSFTFKGSAVYIFGIDQAGVQAEIWFALDGNNNAAQKHHYTGTEKFSYNALFFSATGLSTDIMHTVGWGLAPAGPLPAQGQVALFDYAIVTSEEEDTSTPPIGASTDAGAGGGTAGTSTSSAETPPGTSTTQTSTGSSTMTSAAGTGQSSTGTGDTSQSKNGGSQLTPTPSSPEGKSSAATYSLSGSPHLTSSGDTNTGADGNSTAPPQSPSSRPKSKSNVGAIVGGVIGAVFAALVAIFVWLRCRKVRRLPAEPDPQFLRIEDYYATQNTSPPSTIRQANPFPVSVDRSIFKGEHSYSDAGTGASAASLLASTNAHNTIPYSDSFPQIEPSATTDTRPMYYQQGPPTDEVMVVDVGSTGHISTLTSEDDD